MQDYQGLLKQINAKKIAPFYLLSGTEAFFIDSIVDSLTKALVDEAAAAFDHTILYGKDSSVSQIIESAKRFPMVSEKQLIVVKEAQYMDKQLDELAAYLSQASRQTVLVICWKNKAFDKRKKLYKIAQKVGVVFDSKPLYENQIGNWLQSRAKALDVSLSPEAVRVLQDYLGADLHRIQKALEKLKFVIPEGDIIDPSSIEYHIGISKEFNNFELQKAIGQRNFSQSLRITHYLSQNQKQYPLVLTISSLFGYFQRVMQYHALENKQQAATVLGVSPYFVKEYQLAASHYSLKKCSKALQVIYQADLKSKGIIGGGSTSPEAILKQLVIDVWI
jgi:DNA polymerase-3 subunit delta|tara:strand:- start:1371 stop:2372 length:1002 start_codon:yes stop_codon:yes gene_type:complete